MKVIRQAGYQVKNGRRTMEGKGISNIEQGMSNFEVEMSVRKVDLEN